MTIFNKTRMAVVAALFISKTLFGQCGPQLTCLQSMSSMGVPPTYSMPYNGQAYIFQATDFVASASDSCFAADQLVFALRDADINPGTGFPLGPDSLPQASLAWDCSQVGVNVVEVWAKDPAGNSAMCATYLFLFASYEYNFCVGSGPLAGSIKTQPQWAGNDAQGIAEVSVSVEIDNPAFPLVVNYNTVSNGQFIFYGLPMFAGTIEITPKKDINPLNGVSTFDLVKMSKHVLNVLPFTSPYQFIAADINHNDQVTTFDIVELRKMILGIYPDFPANESWRFVAKNYQFTTATPLEEPFPESIKWLADTAQSPANFDFIGIKIGDVTGDAMPANLAPPAADRSPETFFFILENKKIRAGEAVEIMFEGSEEVAGGQFDLFYKNGQLLEIRPESGLLGENFAQFEPENRISCSFNETCRPRFWVKFRADRDGQLSDFFEIKNARLRPEAYRGTRGERLDIALAFREKTGGGDDFEVFQNQPNPFSEETAIGFYLPTAGHARLRVFDPAGRLLVEKSGKFEDGARSFFISKKEIGGRAGCFFYEIETADGTAVRRMAVAGF